jgi:hypothetical protein
MPGVRIHQGAEVSHNAAVQRAETKSLFTTSPLLVSRFSSCHHPGGAGLTF